MATPLYDQMSALLTYANGITGAGDTHLGDAVRSLADGYGGGGGLPPKLLSVTEFTQETAWETDAVGNADNIFRTYIPSYTDTSDYHIYVLYCENNTASNTGRRFNLGMYFRYSTTVAIQVNFRGGFTNANTGGGTSRSLYISAGAKLYLYKLAFND